MNEVERTRLKLGLTRPQMLRLLGAKAGRTSLFSTEDKDIDDAFARTAKVVSDAYDKWKVFLLGQLDSAIQEYGPHLNPTQAARTLDISEFNLVQLRKRGQVRGSQMVVNRWAYTAPALRDLIESNSTVLSPEMSKARGPLANSFLRWYKRQSQRTKVA